MRESADVGNKFHLNYTFLQAHYLLLRVKLYILLINSSNLQKRCKYGFTLQFRIFSLYYKPFPVIYFRQYLTKQNDVTISDRQDSYPTPPHPNPLPPRGEGG